MLFTILTQYIKYSFLPYLEVYISVKYALQASSRDSLITSLSNTGYGTTVRLYAQALYPGYLKMVAPIAYTVENK